MKSRFTFLLLVFLCYNLTLSGSVKPFVEHVIIQQVNLNLRGAAVVLGQVTIDAPVAGEVLVHFNGNCISTAGDRIILAASNTMNWSTNDGETAVEAYDSDINRNSFSHTRKYSVNAGSNTFYAVGQNFVETEGSGIASVYGMLTVKYFPTLPGPNTPQPMVLHTGVVDVNHNVRGQAEMIASLDLDAPLSGKVLVRFDGICVADPGDLIVIAASDAVSWSTNDGNTGIEAIDNDLNTRTFSHTRSYDIGPGNHTFYGVAQNFVETDGDGIASFYASLTVEYFPDINDGDNWPQLFHEGVSQTNVNVEGAPVTMGEISFDAPDAGRVVVTYDGLCSSSVGDRVVMAASNTENWSANSGNVNVEAISTDLRYNNFSHSRVYDVAAGSNTLYAVAQNFVETAGNGIASNYASLTVEYYPETVVGVNDLIQVDANMEVYPNPVMEVVNLSYTSSGIDTFELQLIDPTGRILKSFGTVESSDLTSKTLDLSDLSAGIYFVRLINTKKLGVKRIVKY
ncbi:MAG: hypothetical protein DHS20C18_08380 [Saprospiraceae bacterium]|nr:MAG: hypothetical protein DHS20C18_08380 [Saprospiraceae bacterium]